MRTSLALVAVVTLGACGRVGFDARAGDATGSARDAAADATPGVLAHVAVFVQRTVTTGATSDTFTVAARNAGDAIPLHVFCESASAPVSVGITAPPAWNVVLLQPIYNVSTFYGTVYGLVAPDTSPAMFTVDWSWGTAGPNCSFIDEMGDEFSGNDPTGGGATFEGAGLGATTGDCAANATTSSANDAIWAACTTNCVSAVGPGFTKGADDGSCDWSEWKLSTDLPGTFESGTFTTTAQTAYVMTTVLIKPR